MLRILSLDGGGVHVLAQAILLKRIFERFPGFYEQIDVFAGTSAGGLLALALAQRGPLALELFCPETIIKIFKRRYSLGMIPGEGITSAKYSNQELIAFLDKQFQEATVQNCPKKIFIPAFKLSGILDGQPSGRWHPEFFTNIQSQQSAETTLLRDVGVRTAAAPTYFPIYQNYSDGGIFCNNPVASALVHCLDRELCQRENCVALSLSGGCQAQEITQVSGDWGLYQWMSYLVSMLIDSNVYMANDTCRSLLDDNYHRFQLKLPEDVPLDGTDQLGTLIDAAENINLDPLFEWISSKWNQTFLVQ